VVASRKSLSRKAPASKAASPAAASAAKVAGIPFLKVEGLGNDFLIVDATKYDVPETEKFAVAVCNRNFGVGADGVLYYKASTKGDFYMRILNSDGSEAEMCGNGIRCMARWAFETGRAKATEMNVETLGGMRVCRLNLNEDGTVKDVTVDMGAPKLARSNLPMTGTGTYMGQMFEMEPGKTVPASAVSMGNPHFILFTEASVDKAKQVGPLLERHPWFPKRTNVEFAEPVSGREINLVVWERGAGLTLACGTGACATVVAAALGSYVEFDREVKVNLPGGSLYVTVPKDLSRVWMRGPATFVYAGQLDPKHVAR
jgi:diaminopimelate epimerase